MKAIVEKIKNLELSLLQANARHSMKTLNQLLADDFVEFGVSGIIYHKKDILVLLPKEKNPVEIVMFDFKLKQYAEDIVHVTYKTLQHEKLALRSSLWKKNQINEWQMCFHQGTKA